VLEWFIYLRGLQRLCLLSVYAVVFLEFQPVNVWWLKNKKNKHVLLFNAVIVSSGLATASQHL